MSVEIDWKNEQQVNDLTVKLAFKLYKQGKAPTGGQGLTPVWTSAERDYILARQILQSASRETYEKLLGDD
jgi:hypothetical protein